MTITNLIRSRLMMMNESTEHRQPDKNHAKIYGNDFQLSYSSSFPMGSLNCPTAII